METQPLSGTPSPAFPCRFAYPTAGCWLSRSKRLQACAGAGRVRLHARWRALRAPCQEPRGRLFLGALAPSSIRTLTNIPEAASEHTVRTGSLVPHRSLCWPLRVLIWPLPLPRASFSSQHPDFCLKCVPDGPRSRGLKQDVTQHGQPRPCIRHLPSVATLPFAGVGWRRMRQHLVGRKPSQVQPGPVLPLSCGLTHKCCRKGEPLSSQKRAVLGPHPGSCTGTCFSVRSARHGSLSLANSALGWEFFTRLSILGNLMFFCFLFFFLY